MTIQDEVQAAVDARVAAGDEDGVQVCVLHRGEVVADVVAGGLEAGSLVFAASAAKGPAAIAVHALVARGAFAYDDRIASLWPAFAAHGKDEATVRDALTHAAGVPGLWPTIDPRTLADGERMTTWLAAQRPWWTPGTATGYHALTWGFLLGEVVRRATGRTLAEVLRDDVAGPLGVADELHFGVPPALLGRVAPASAAGGEPPAPPPGSPAERAIPPRVRPTSTYAADPVVLQADVPSQGTMSARAAARAYAALLGHVPGVELVPRSKLQAIAAPAIAGHDLVMGVDTTWALGFSPLRPGALQRPPGTTVGMLGSTGAIAFADLEAEVAVAVLRTRVDGSTALAAAVDRVVLAHLG